MSSDKRGDFSRGRTFLLGASSVTLAAATALDLLGVGDEWRWLAPVLAAAGFLSLAAAGVLTFVIRQTARRKNARSGERTALIDSGDPVRETLPPRDSIPATGQARDRVEGMRLAGIQDLPVITRAGKDYLGDEFFYDESELAGYLHKQRDSIWCFDERADAGTALRGYAILLSLRPRTVERIKSGEIVYGRNILPSDILNELDDSDAVYLSMVHGFSPEARRALNRFIIDRTVEADRRRRPQLLLARGGTASGILGMERLGFEPFGSAPVIRATFTDNASFVRDVQRRRKALTRLKNAAR